MASRITLTSLLPELFPLIASHLPLYATPLTLLSLALTNHRMYEIIHDLLYSYLILRNEKDVLSIFQRILANAELGRTVRELHVMSELSVASLHGETAFDAVAGLIRLVKGGYLPYIHTLTLHLSGEWRKDEMWNDTIGIGHLPLHFWEDLEDKCPRLRTLVVSGLGENLSESWLHESGIYELKGMKKLTQLGITFNRRVHSRADGPQRLLKSLCDLSPSLHTLTLGILAGVLSGHHSAPLILSQNFPRLRSLTLVDFSVPDTSESMAFWRRHPLIEKLKLRDTELRDHWFSETVEDDFLPNLKYLEASFHDVRSLIPILPRLTGLSVRTSLNTQVSYLLRCLIPPGLPNLESLEIDQNWSTKSDRVRAYEGSMWYETPDGKFHTDWRTRDASRTFVDHYIRSIVRGAPNIKELCLHDSPGYPLTMERLVPQLAEFGQLERLYFGRVNNFDNSRHTQQHRDVFYTSSRTIAEQCKSLERITDIGDYFPYVAVKIQRNHDGKVEEVIPTEGYGMTIGSEDEAFPRNPEPSVRVCI